MSTDDGRMRESGDDRIAVTELVESLEVLGRLEVTAGLLRKKRRCVQAEVEVDQHDPPWLAAGRSPVTMRGRSHHFQPRQRRRHAGTFQERSAVDRVRLAHGYFSGRLSPAQFV